MFVYRSPERKSADRHLPPREPQVCLATANARRCWEPYQGPLFMNLWMGCGYPWAAMLSRWGEPVD